VTGEIAVVLDASALLSYLAGEVAVGELMAEVADEGQHVGVPAVCLAAAHAAIDNELGTALLALLVTAPVIRQLPLGADPGVDDARQAGTLARAAGGDLAVGHAARAAIAHQAHFATTRSKTVAAVLPAGWSILDLSQT